MYVTIEKLKKLKIILGSASEARKLILGENLGLPFKVIESGYAEDLPKNLPPRKWVEQIAINKLLCLWSKIKNTSDADADVLITADTIIVKDNKIYGKPKSGEDAIQTLTELSKGAFECITGVCVGIINGKEMAHSSFINVTKLEMETSNEDIINYAKTGEPFGKAGSFCIFKKGCLLFKAVDGDFLSVWGFPAHDFMKLMSKLI